MPRKLRELRADLRRHGASVISQSGSHEKWKYPLVPDHYVVLAGADGADAKPYQDKDVREMVRAIRGRGGSTEATATMNAARYSMLIQWSDEDSAYVVSFPEWEAVGLIGHTHGETYAEAVRKGEEMLQFLFDSAQAEGDPIPELRRFSATA
jgi:predicted RNase H-like HicB family nuclease